MCPMKYSIQDYLALIIDFLLHIPRTLGLSGVDISSSITH